MYIPKPIMNKVIEDLKWLSDHNKNYNNKQYNLILEILELLGAL